MVNKIFLTVLFTTLMQANITMCFLKNHSDPATVDNSQLSGKNCTSVNDMKSNGYNLEDMKISNSSNGLDYVFIFKTKSNVIDQNDLKTQLKNLQKDQEQQNEKELLSKSIKNGKELYLSNCKECHGDGTISAYNYAEPLLNLTSEEIEVAIRDYSLDQRDKGMAILMSPIANSLTDQDVIDVSNYLETLK